MEKTDEEMEPIKRKPQHHSIMDLKPGLSNVEVKAKVLTMEEREVSVGDAGKKVYTGVMGDETGKIRYTSWVDFGIREGDVIRIEGAYIKSWRGAPQLVFDEKSKVEKLEEEMQVSSEKIPIYRVVEAGGGVEVGIDGVIIEIQDGSGLIYRCPKCNRAIRDGVCVVDGEVEGVPDLRIKAIVDDGTGAVKAIIGRNVTEKITGKTLKEYEEMAGGGEGGGTGGGLVEEDMKNLLIARPIHITGNALADEYGVTVIVQDAEVVTPAVQQERDELMAKMEAMK